MREFTDVCEHCGNPIRSGLLYCDNCGKGIAKNFAAYYKKATIRGLTLLALSVVSVLAFILYMY
jgi:predicted amidophosphoribosyltransferase